MARHRVDVGLRCIDNDIEATRMLQVRSNRPPQPDGILLFIPTVALDDKGDWDFGDMQAGL